MTAKVLIIAVLAFAISAPLARAQEEEHEMRWEYMHRLRIACDAGDERACWRLRHMRREWRERHWHEEEHY